MFQKVRWAEVGSGPRRDRGLTRSRPIGGVLRLRQRMRPNRAVNRLAQRIWGTAVQAVSPNQSLRQNSLLSKPSARKIEGFRILDSKRKREADLLDTFR